VTLRLAESVKFHPYTNLALASLLALAGLLAIAPPLRGQSSFNFNADDGGFTVASGGPVETVWTYGATAGVGGNGAWFVNGTTNQGTPSYSILTSPALTVSTTGSATLSFDHRFSFEYDGTRWDGGQVQMSLNGGAFTTVALGYTGTITGNGILSGQQGFNGDSAGYATPSYITSTATLGSFTAGDSITIRFVGAWDEFATGTVPNWVVDNVSVSNVAVPEPHTYAALLGLATLGWAFYRHRSATDRLAI
jgi:hypothetical protein